MAGGEQKPAQPPVEFAQFGVVNFAPFTKVAAFAKGLSEGRIMATRCNGCGRLEFPPKADCPECSGKGFEWTAISGRGTLVTYTTIHSAPTGFEDRAPYTIGLIDLEEGGRLLSWVQGVTEAELKVGMPLVAHIERLQAKEAGKPERFIYVLKRPG